MCNRFFIFIFSSFFRSSFFLPSPPFGVHQSKFFCVFLFWCFWCLMFFDVLILMSPWYSQEIRISWAEPFLLGQISLLFFCIHHSLYLLCVSLCFFPKYQRIQRKSSWRVQKKIKFNSTTELPPMSFMFLGCTMVTLRSKTLLHIITPHSTAAFF